MLLKKVAVFAPTPLSLVDAKLVDGNKDIFHTFWPKNSTMKHFVDSFVNQFTRPHDTYIIFDRYDDQSIKSHERQRRAKGNKSREYVLTSHTQLPPKDEIMTSNHNKKALIKCLCEVETNDRLKLIWDESREHDTRKQMLK